MNRTLPEILFSKYGIAAEIIKDAEKRAIEQNIRLGEVLVKKKIVSEEQLLKAVGEMYDIAYIKKIPFDNVDIDFTESIPIQYLKKYHIVPVIPLEESELKNTLMVINDPSSLQAIDDIVRLLNLEDYSLRLATRDSIILAINNSYNQKRDSAAQLVQDMEDNSSVILDEMSETADLLDDTSDSQIIKLVNHIISQSIKARASDIHIEPYQDSFKVRYRVDGILYDLLTPPKWIQASLISRIKVMAKLNIAEKRLPQDGRIEVRIGEHDVDIRVSTVPISFGERVVLRLLNKSSSLLTLSEFDMEKEHLDLMNDLITKPNGIVLVTGPTGSGKTTTLYAAISSINSPDKNIITVEDPIEYQIKGIGQIQVNKKIGLTFATGLRSIVRQDPDVILVGEIRDGETAEIAIQSALTGHLVFSTLHTNDAASAVTRLVDIGMEPFLLSSALNAVVAQRLVRTLCEDCKEIYHPHDKLLEIVGIKPSEIEGIPLYRQCGCEKCFDTGYRGREAIFEILVLDEFLKGVILEKSDSNIIKKFAIEKNGMKTLRMDGIKKILKGVTTIEEVLRVTHI